MEESLSGGDILTKQAMKSLLSIALLSLGTLGAQTLTESQTEVFGPGATDYSTILTFDKYSGDLSHIIDIEVTWTMAISDGFLIIDNDGSNPASGTYDFGAQLNVDAGGTNVILTDNSFQQIFSNTEVTNSGAFSLAGDPIPGNGDGDFDPTGPDGISISGAADSTNGGGSINTLYHSLYVSGLGGTGGTTFNITLDTIEFLNVTSNGATQFALTPVNASGSVTVKYTLIPEPSVGILSLLGGAALLLRRRRA